MAKEGRPADEIIRELQESQAVYPLTGSQIIKLHEEGGWWIEETVKGDSATEVLRYMQYDVERLVPQFARDCERAVREGRISLPESQAMRRFYEAELGGYTYLEP